MISICLLGFVSYAVALDIPAVDEEIQEEEFTQAPTGKAALRTEKLSKDAPGSKGGVVTKPIKIVLAVLFVPLRLEQLNISS